MSGSALDQFEILRSPRPVADDERARLLENPGFGRVFTDHMVTIRYTEGKGWHDARVEPFGPLSLSPATAVLHYAQEIFEGMKAYHRGDGTVGLFRPWENARRFQRSARRMAMPELPEDLFLGSIEALIAIDRAWIPSGADTSLYLRPFMFASEAFLGVRPSLEYVYGLIASPAGAYFKAGPKPVSMWVSHEYTRAAPGGTGDAKCGGNYATSLLPQSQAAEHGCEQVVFLDAVHRRYVDELGGMNVFFVYEGDKRVITPELGTILPGITRDAVIALARDEGYEVVEDRYAVDTWKADAASGALTEVFACGTAAVVTPIGRVKDVEGEFPASGGAAGPLTMRLRERLLAIQYGEAEDVHGWTTTIA